MTEYYRIINMDGDIFPFAVGTKCLYSGRSYPPTDGHPYYTSDEIGPAVEACKAAAKKKRLVFPWEEVKALR